MASETKECQKGKAGDFYSGKKHKLWVEPGPGDEGSGEEFDKLPWAESASPSPEPQEPTPVEIAAREANAVAALKRGEKAKRRFKRQMASAPGKEMQLGPHISTRSERLQDMLEAYHDLDLSPLKVAKLVQGITERFDVLWGQDPELFWAEWKPYYADFQQQRDRRTKGLTWNLMC